MKMHIHLNHVQVRKCLQRYQKSYPASKWTIVPTINSQIKKIHYSIKFSCVKKEYLGGIELCLDIKTRWKSLIAMIKGFLKHTNLIRKLMIDFEYDYSFSNNNIKRLEVFVRVLEPLEIALKKICQRDSNLLESHKIINFLQKTLIELDSEFSETVASKIDTEV